MQFEDVPDGWRVAAELPSGTRGEFSSWRRATTSWQMRRWKWESSSEFGFDQSGAHFRVVVDGKEWHREKLESILQRHHRVRN